MRLRQPIIMLLISLLAMGGAIFLIYPPAKTTKLGLDLKGGLSVILTAEDTPKAKVTPESMEQALLIIRQRVDKLGVAEPEIQQQGSRSILVQLPGVKKADEALEIIGKPAFLEFAIVNASYQSLEVAELNERKKEGEPVLNEAELTGADLASARESFGGQLGAEPIVDITFKRPGAKKFSELTTVNVGKNMAIVLDGEIISAPVIREPILAGAAQISGIGSLDEAKRIALVLQTGALPVKLDVSTYRTVGPTLGRSSLMAGIRAGILGFILVAIYMLLYYRVLGFVTWLGLAVFATLFWGIIALLGRFDLMNLTLPGIAGAILTIGIAADSKIIIFERIKEEIGSGSSFRTAVDSGFWHAFRTILDADGVTFITAGILFWLGVGPVRGFALTLIIGIFLDMFTFVFFTRSVLRIMARFPSIGSAKMIGLRLGSRETAS